MKSERAGALAAAIADRTPIIVAAVVAAAGIAHSASFIFLQDKQVPRMQRSLSRTGITIRRLAQPPP
jgi:hypothetical protein